ncbi:MAG: glycosyltransferase [Eubacteriales bacterium]|nr:glycosyltransferase [Eubacteriales bacterium]
MTTQPLVSIIVPVYNAQATLRRCLDSLCAQTHSNLEILLINDGSRDESGAICDEYQAGDARFCALHQPNGGPGAARNAGLDRATGQYRAFVDSDDFVQPDFIAFLLDNLLAEQADISICGYCEVDAAGKMGAAAQPMRRVMDADAAMGALLENRWFKDYFWNKLYRAALFDGLRFVPGRIYEDVELQYRIFQRAHSVVFDNQPKYCYVETPGSIQHGGFNLAKMDAVYFSQQIADDVRRRYPQHTAAAQAKLVRCAGSIAHEIARNGVISAFAAPYAQCLDIVRRQYHAGLRGYFAANDAVKLFLMKWLPFLYGGAARLAAALKAGR